MTTKSMNAIDKHVSNRLKAARVASNLSQEEAGDRINVSFQQVQKYEHGTNRISAGKMAMLANLYGVSIEWLFDGAPVGNARA